MWIFKNFNNKCKMYWAWYLLSLLFLIFVSLQVTFWVKLFNDIKIKMKTANVLDVHELKFKSYVKDFNKHYSGEEYEWRFQNFKASLKQIAIFNAMEGNNVFGLTKFSDMSKEEFASRMLLRPDPLRSCIERKKNCTNNAQHPASSFSFENDRTIPPPTNCDWRKEKDVIGPILNQKLCLGCWAFSIVGVMESMAAIRGLGYDRRSIQELLDCSVSNNGCWGGDVNIAMDYLCRRTDPIFVVTEEEYPLTLSYTKNCKIKHPKSGRRLKSFYYRCNVNENYIVEHIANKGPLIAAVDATNWMHYIGGIIQRACFNHISNHVVQIVGYDGYQTEEPRIPYYIIKNSFGEDFGDQGYVKIAMNNNVCGIADQVTSIEVI